ncbi:MAG TPA: helix-turn-helix domain-containing protein [Chloroflexia bacterium]|nr:helix-turn-helix domain-containing protein [Chloroflexia bacterium]
MASKSGEKLDKLEMMGCVDPDTKKLYMSFMLLQEKWVLFIIQSLLERPLGFNEISRKAVNVCTTTLSQRLSLLEKTGLVTRTVQSTMPPRTSYELTEAGRGLEVVIEAIREWGEKYVDEEKAQDVACS